VYVLQARFKDLKYAIVRINEKTEDNQIDQYDKIIDNVNANHNFGMMEIHRTGDRPLVRIKLTRVDFMTDEFYIRLANDLTCYMHHNGKDILMGDVDFLIKNQNKRFFLN